MNKQWRADADDSQQSAVIVTTTRAAVLNGLNLVCLKFAEFAGEQVVAGHLLRIRSSIVAKLPG
jgi:hypothetical protein